MHRLITLGAQHQGIMNVPECWNPSYNMTPAAPFCWAMQRLLGWGAYLPYIRTHVIQAQYFKVSCALYDGRALITCLCGHGAPPFQHRSAAPIPLSKARHTIAGLTGNTGICDACAAKSTIMTSLPCSCALITRHVMLAGVSAVCMRQHPTNKDRLTLLSTCAWPVSLGAWSPPAHQHLTAGPSKLDAEDVHVQQSLTLRTVLQVHT